MTLKETQAALKLSRCTVLKFIYSGELVAAKLGNCWRISADDLAAFIASRRRT